MRKEKNYLFAYFFTDYITRMYKDAKRRYEAHFKAISTATDFIECAKAHLEKQKQEAAQTEAKP